MSESKQCVFFWQGLDKKAHKVKGFMLSQSKVSVKFTLKQKSIQIIRIERKDRSLFWHLFHREKRTDITLLTRQIGTLLRAGLPILDVLKMIEKSQKKYGMKAILSKIIENLENGNPLSSSLKLSSKHFDKVDIELVLCGEMVGDLATIFERIYHYRITFKKNTEKVFNALIYPISVLFASALVIQTLTSHVLPQFKSMLNGFSAPMPRLTQQVISITEALNSYLLPLFIFTFFTIGLGYLLSTQSTSFRFRISRLLLCLPLIGDLIRKSSIARFSRTFSLTLQADISIINCLTISASTTNNYYYKRIIKAMTMDITAGTPIYIAIQKTKAFPIIVEQMAMIGEQTGKLDEVFSNITEIYEQEVSDTVLSMEKVLEPAIILILGGIVALVVISMYLPIFNLMTVLG